MSSGKYNRSGNSGRGGYHPYRPPLENNDDLRNNFHGHQPYRNTHNVNNYRYSSQQHQQNPQSHGYHYQAPYDDYQGYDYGYRGQSSYRGRGRGGGRGGGYYSNVNGRNGAPPPAAYGYQSDPNVPHPYARNKDSYSSVAAPATVAAAPATAASTTPSEPVKEVKPEPQLDLSEKHWIERMHVKGDMKKSLSTLFDDLDRVNMKLIKVGIKRMDLEIEVMKLNRFSKTGDERCKLAEEQLESMNLEF